MAENPPAIELISAQSTRQISPARLIPRHARRYPGAGATIVGMNPETYWTYTNITRRANAAMSARRPLAQTPPGQNASAATLRELLLLESSDGSSHHHRSRPRIRRYSLPPTTTPVHEIQAILAKLRIAGALHQSPGMTASPKSNAATESSRHRPRHGPHGAKTKKRRTKSPGNRRNHR